MSVAALRDSEQRLHTVVANAPVVLSALDRHGVYTLSEGKGLSALGLRAGERVGHSLFDFYPDGTEVAQGARAALAGTPWAMVARVRGRVLESTWTPVRDEAGEVSGAIAVSSDVTDRAEAEEALQASEERLQIVVDHAPVILFSLDRQGVYTLAGGQGLRALGVSPATLVGQTVLDIATGGPSTADDIRRALAGEAVTGTVRIGELIYDAPYVPVRDQSGVVTSVTGIWIDVTEGARAQAALEKERQQLRGIVMHAPVAMAMFDREMLYVAHSQQWLSERGMQGRDLISRNHYEVFPTVPQSWRDGYRRALDGETIVVAEDTLEQADGALAYVRWAATPWYDADGVVGGIVIVTASITELVQAREAALVSGCAARPIPCRAAAPAWARCPSPRCVGPWSGPARVTCPRLTRSD